MSKVLGPKEYDLQTKYKAEDGHVSVLLTLS
jgi:hypothetical protein